MKPTFQIEIPRRSSSCAKGHESFAPGAEYYSVLVEGPNGELQRQDFCLTCWDESARQESVKNARSYWKSKVPKKQVTEPLSRNRDERALQLLKQALNAETPHNHEEAFVLALFLARSRVLYLRQLLQQEDGSKINLYEVAATEEMLAVKKIDLPQLQIDKIQQQLAEKMNIKESCNTNL
jgi:hypothetical protein